jgi:uncharacterized membrane protein SirB2
MYPILKNLHMTLAALTLAGFLLRAWWMARQPEWLQASAVRVLPHVVDTLFLLSGIGLIVLLRLPLLQSPWLMAKLAALVIYIALGTIALKRGRTKRIRMSAFALALLTFGYIVGVAVSKSPFSWVAFG